MCKSQSSVKSSQWFPQVPFLFFCLRETVKVQVKSKKPKSLEKHASSLPLLALVLPGPFLWAALDEGCQLPAALAPDARATPVLSARPSLGQL